MVRSFVVGVGMTAFEKPRNRRDYPEIGLEAAVKALLDAGVNYDDVEQAYVGYCYGDSTSGQAVVYQLGMTSIPVINVNNNCSTGSTAFFLARQAVESGTSDCVMALGFEKMSPGSLKATWEDRTNPLKLTNDFTRDRQGSGPGAAQIFGNGAAEYVEKYGAKWEHVAAIAAKNHNHSKINPYSQFRNGMTTDEVMKDKKITNYLTRGMCCPTSDGGACAIIASEEFVKKHKLENQAIEILAQALTTDTTMLYDERSAIELTGADMTRRAAKQVFKKSGLTVNDLAVIELHDCFAANELLLYDSLGLTAPGKAHELVEKGDITYGGKFVINPSGGLESKGHPLGATGLGMVFYLVCQLRGWAGPMQVKHAGPGNKKYALAHNLGLGGAAVVSILGRPSFYEANSNREDGRKRLGYEYGYECREITQADFDKVKSRRQFSKNAHLAGLQQARL